MLFWVDGTPDFYHQEVFLNDLSVREDLCAHMLLVPRYVVHYEPCKRPMGIQSVLCEKQVSLIINHRGVGWWGIFSSLTVNCKARWICLYIKNVALQRNDLWSYGVKQGAQPFDHQDLGSLIPVLKSLKIIRHGHDNYSKYVRWCTYMSVAPQFRSQ